MLAGRAVVKGEDDGVFLVLIVRVLEADRARLESCEVEDTPLRADIGVAVTDGVACPACKGNLQVTAVDAISCEAVRLCLGADCALTTFQKWIQAWERSYVSRVCWGSSVRLGSCRGPNRALLGIRGVLPCSAW